MGFGSGPVGLEHPGGWRSDGDGRRRCSHAHGGSAKGSKASWSIWVELRRRWVESDSIGFFGSGRFPLPGK